MWYRNARGEVIGAVPIPLSRRVLHSRAMALGMVRQTLVCAVVAISLPVLAGIGQAQPSASGRSGAAITPFEARKAKALLHDHLPCLGCHTLNGTGGLIGPDLTQVAARRSQAYIAAMVADPQGTVPGSLMPRVAMPDATRELLVRYLVSRADSGSLASTSGSAPTPTSVREPAASAPPDGAALYARHCAACHGERGRGDGPNAARLPVPPAAHASREVMSRRSDDALFDTIYGGGAVMNRSPRMPPYGETLSRAQIRALVRHIRTLCRCEGPGWSRDGRSAP